MNERIYDEEYILKSRPSFETENFAHVKNSFLKAFRVLSQNNEKSYIGVDWMKGNWIACELQGTYADYKTFDNIDELCRYYELVDNILIDMPVGLPETKEEANLRPDQAARDYLKVKSRKSSVFNVPYRQLVYANSEAEVWELNKKLDARLSKPGVGILSCIRQVDEFLHKNKEWRVKLIESHPECAFQALNNGVGIVASKHTNDGIEQRIDILSAYVSNIC